MRVFTLFTLNKEIGMSDTNNKLCTCKGNGCEGCKECSSGGRCCGMEMQTLIRGILALAFGLLFVGFAYRIVLRMVFFGAGVSLIYYGFRVLGVTQVTDYIDMVIAKIRKAFWA